VHLEMVDHRDVFKVKAWSSSPINIPSEIDVEIVEPPTNEAVKHTLLYPIKLTVVPTDRPVVAPMDPPSPLSSSDARWHRWRRRHSDSPLTLERNSQVLVHARLGPRLGEDGYVEPRHTPSLAALFAIPPSPSDIHAMVVGPSSEGAAMWIEV
jgi:hypothetical protein